MVERGLLPPEVPFGARCLVEGFAPHLLERSQTLVDAIGLIDWAFVDTVAFDPAAVAKWLKPPADVVLERAEAELPDLDWTAEAIEAWRTALAEELETGLGRVMQPLRVAVSGRAVTPPLPQTLAVLDRDLVLARLADARKLVAA